MYSPTIYIIHITSVSIPSQYEVYYSGGNGIELLWNDEIYEILLLNRLMGF